MSLQDLAFPSTPQASLAALDELSNRGAEIAQELAETRMDASGHPAPKLDDLAAVAHSTRNVPGSSSAVPAVNINILALDLGTYTGYALRRRDGTVIHGTEHFMQRRAWHPGQRFVNFRLWLGEFLEAQKVHLVIYENVVFGHSSTQAANVYGGFLATMLMCAALRNLECTPVAVPTIKKSWTGRGHAKKADMIAEARRRGFMPVDDNAADALAVLHWAIAQEAQR